MPRALLGYDGTNFYVLKVDSDGHLQVDVLSSALPSGAATAANQASMVTALQLIDDLQKALQSVATDRLVVRGEDQLFSLKGVLAVSTSGNPSGANGYIESPAVPEGEYWVVTNVVIRDNNTALTSVRFRLRHDGNEYDFGGVTKAVVAGECVPWNNVMYADESDTIRAYLAGCAAGDTCYIWVTGHRVTVES
jgi:hypothetical protein